MIVETPAGLSNFGLLMSLASGISIGVAGTLLIELPAKRGQFLAPSVDRVVFPAFALIVAGDGAFELRHVLLRRNQPMFDYWVLGIYVVTIAVIAISHLFALRRMCLTGG